MMHFHRFGQYIDSSIRAALTLVRRIRVRTIISLVLLCAVRSLAAQEIVDGRLATAGTPLPPPLPYQTQTVQVGSLRIVVKSLPEYDWPMSPPHALYTITNVGSTPISGASVNATVNGVTSVQPMQPPFLYLDPGESQTTSVQIGESFGLNSYPVEPTSVTVRATVAGQGFVETTFSLRNWVTFLCSGSCNPPPLPPGSSMTVAGRVIDEQGNPISSTMGLGSRGTRFSDQIRTTVRPDGSFTVTVPKATTWNLIVSKPGYRSAFVFFDEARDYPNVEVVLHPYVGPQFTYQPAVAKEYLNAFWHGTLSSDERLVLLSPGMEHWSPAMTPYQASQKVMLYTTDGQKVWEQPTGEDAKGSALSGDSKWAVYTGAPTRASGALPGLLSRVVLVDASDGHTIWQKALRDFPNDHPEAPVDSAEARISSDGLYIVEGETFYLRGLGRSDGQLLWSKFTKGPVRSIHMSSDGSTFYAVSAARALTRMAIADGRVLWTATASGSFAHQTGIKESPDGTMVGTIGVEGGITVADARTGQILWTWITNDPGHFVGFSSDSQVFVASTLSGTWGFVARTGARLFVLGGSEGGSFAKGRDFFVLPNGPLSVGVYDTTGTLVSNIISGLDWTTPNYYTALITSDLKRLVFALREAQGPSKPVLFFASMVDISQSDCLFNWAERTYPTLFAPVAATSNTWAPYYYRYYPQTNAFLATSSDDDHVYYLGPSSNNTILDAGALTGWLSTAGCQ